MRGWARRRKPRGARRRKPRGARRRKPRDGALWRRGRCRLLRRHCCGRAFGGGNPGAAFCGGVGGAARCGGSCGGGLGGGGCRASRCGGGGGAAFGGGSPGAALSGRVAGVRPVRRRPAVPGGGSRPSERGPLPLDGGIRRRALLRGLVPSGDSAAPHVTDRKSERVGGIGGLRRRIEPENPGHHGGHLCLVGATRTGDRGLDLARRVQSDRNAPSCRHQHRHPGGLSGAHHGLDVVLGEHALHRHRVGPVLDEPGVDLLLEPAQPTRDIEVGRGPDHVDPDQLRRPPRPPVDHTQTASRQAGIDPEHSHPDPPDDQPNRRS